MDPKKIIHILNRNGIGVLLTDTLYGVVGRALSPETVERLYEVRGREPQKPFIILIADVLDLAIFGIDIESPEVWTASKYWPGKVSVILPCALPEFEYLHRGAGTIAFRIPDKPELREVIRETGPLAAPSANLEGMPPALTIDEAHEYFEDNVDFYEDEGEAEPEPSTLIAIEGEKVTVLRAGAEKIEELT